MGLFLSSPRRPSIGDVRVHKTNSYWYVYEFDPKTDALAWLRFDSFVLGKISHKALKKRKVPKTSLGRMVSSAEVRRARRKLIRTGKVWR